MSLIEKKLIVTVSLTTVLLQACASGQSSSFATRVSSDGSTQSFAESASGDGEGGRFAMSDDSRPMVLASSGNVLLPGAFNRALTGFGGSSLTPGQTPMGADLAGQDVSAMLNGSISLTRTEQNGPELALGLGGGLAATGAAGSPLLAAITPMAQGADGLTGGLLSGATATVAGVSSPLANGAATSPLVTASAGGVSVAGQPLVSLGAGSVLANVGSAAGGAASGAGNIVSGVNPGSATSGIVNAAAGEVASAAGNVAGPTSPISGLGGLTGALPGLRR